MGDELSVQEKHDLGHALTDGDIRELERGEEQTETDADRQAAEAAEKQAAESSAKAVPEAEYVRNGDGSYTRDSDGTVGTFGPDGFEPYE